MALPYENASSGERAMAEIQFQRDNEGAHDALADVREAAAIYFHILDNHKEIL